MNIENDKKLAAEKACMQIEEGMIVGVGTGSTVNYFIEALAKKQEMIKGVVASSSATLEKLKYFEFPIIDPNTTSYIDIYVDGADEANEHKQLIKGGGAALTGEKILAAMSRKFICIIDGSKKVDILGRFPLPVEVISLARSFVARELVKLDGDPMYRQGTITDYGNIILDVYNLHILEPEKLEEIINNIPGVVTNGIFAKNKADEIIMCTNGEISFL